MERNGRVVSSNVQGTSLESMKCFLFSPFLFLPIKTRPHWPGQGLSMGSIHVVLLFFQESEVSVSCLPHQRFSSVTCDWILGSQSPVSPVFSSPALGRFASGEPTLRAISADLSATNGRPWCLQRAGCCGGSMSAKGPCWSPLSTV